MNIYKISELILYQLIDLIPNLLLACFVFSNYLRISKLKLGLIISGLYFILVISRIFALTSLYAATFFSVAWIFLYLLFYGLCIRTELSKLLFVLLVILNYGSFTSVICSFFAHHVLSGDAVRPYSLQSSLIYLSTLVITYPFIYWLLVMKVKLLIEFSENNRIWKILWIIPATFCLSYYYNLYSNGGITIFSGKINNVLFAAAYNIGGLIVTWIVILLVEDSNANMKLKLENYQLNLRFVQYENLKNRMEESRRARHDLRQSMAVIQSYLRDDNKEGLHEYIQQYSKTLPSDSTILHCHDYALNALIVYYEQQAKEREIIFYIKMTYEHDNRFADPDIAVLLGNLIENALDACSKMVNGQPYISLCIQQHEGNLIITLDNSYNGSIHKSNNVFLSSKTGQPGIGITSIQKIAQQYNGVAKFEYDELVFRASVLLYP